MTPAEIAALLRHIFPAFVTFLLNDVVPLSAWEPAPGGQRCPLPVYGLTYLHLLYDAGGDVYRLTPLGQAVVAILLLPEVAP